MGWDVANQLRKALAKDAVMMVQARRYRDDDVTNLVYHSDRCVHFKTIRYGKASVESNVVASVGSMREFFDNAMAKALNSVDNAELIDRHAWSG